MSKSVDDYPEWLLEQKGKPYRSPGYLKRDSLVRRYEVHVRGAGEAVNFDDIRRMLQFVDRGYSLKPSQISRALAGHYRTGEVAKAPNGRPVTIDGTRYQSSRAAAEALGVSPQTVLNRIASPRERWKGWCR